jgi:hypothetical protein
VASSKAVAVVRAAVFPDLAHPQEDQDSQDGSDEDLPSRINRDKGSISL